MPKPLYKTTIVIWTGWDASETDLDVLATDAANNVFGAPAGNLPALCSRQDTELIEDPEADPDWNGGRNLYAD